jgi:hypothetical protein
MHIVTSDGYEYMITRISETEVEVSGNPEALQVLTDSAILGGTDQDHPGVMPIEDGQVLRMSEGTAALWLSFEVLNYL